MLAVEAWLPVEVVLWGCCGRRGEVGVGLGAKVEASPSEMDGVMPVGTDVGAGFLTISRV